MTNFDTLVYNVQKFKKKEKKNLSELNVYKEKKKLWNFFSTFFFILGQDLFIYKLLNQQAKGLILIG